MTTEFLRDFFDNESSSSSSSSSSLSARIDEYDYVRSLVFLCLYGILLCFPLGLFIITMKHFCKSRKQAREFREGLLPDEKVSSMSFNRSGIGRDRVWTTIFCIFLAFGTIGHVIAYIVVNLVATGELTASGSYNPSFLERKVQFLSASLCNAAYIIVLGMWLKLYIILLQLHRDTPSAMAGSVSVPDVYSRTNEWKVKKWLLPSCLVMSVLQIIAAVIGVLFIQGGNSLDPSTIIGIVVYSLLTIGYFVYAMLLVSLFRWRFRNRSACSTVTYVIILSLLLCVTFLFRIFIMIDPPEDEKIDRIMGYIYYIFGDIVPQVLIILLYAKNISTSGTTSKTNRIMWASA